MQMHCARGREWEEVRGMGFDRGAGSPPPPSSSSAPSCGGRNSLIRQRDPKGYKEEFLSQHNHYLSLLRLNSAATGASTSAVASQSNNDKDKSNELFADLITFICQVAQCYPAETKELPEQLQGLLLGRNGYTMVRGDLRKTAVKNLVMLRNKEVIDSIE